MLSLGGDSRTHWTILMTCKPACRSWLAAGHQRQHQSRSPAAKNGSEIFQRSFQDVDHPIPKSNSKCFNNSFIKFATHVLVKFEMEFLDEFETSSVFAHEAMAHILGIKTTIYPNMVINDTIYSTLTWSSGTTLCHALWSSDKLVQAAMNQQLPREP